MTKLQQILRHLSTANEQQIDAVLAMFNMGARVNMAVIDNHIPKFELQSWVRHHVSWLDRKLVEDPVQFTVTVDLEGRKPTQDDMRVLTNALQLRTDWIVGWTAPNQIIFTPKPKS